MFIETWGQVFERSFQDLWTNVLNYAPRLVVAIVIFVVGWVIALAIGKVVEQVVRTLHVDAALESLGMRTPIERAGLQLDSGAFIGGLVRWFFIIVFLLAATDALDLHQVSTFLQEVLNYLPNVFIASIMLVAAALLADVMERIVSGSARAAHLPSAGFLGGVARWSIWVFAILAALYQLNVAPAFVQTLFTGFIAMVAIAGGLAFGLGGKEAAARFLEKLQRQISER